MEQANNELRLGWNLCLIDAVNACPSLAPLAVVWQSDAISDGLRFLTFRFGISLSRIADKRPNSLPASCLFSNASQNPAPAANGRTTTTTCSMATVTSGASCGRTRRRERRHGFGRSPRGCRNTHMIEATRRAERRRWQRLRRRGWTIESDGLEGSF
jgi:hypothetical protein